MKFFENETVDGLKSAGIATFNKCEHYLVKPHANTEQTLVIELQGGKYLTVNINPKADNVDVKMHGEHIYKHFGDSGKTDGIHAFFNMRNKYNNDKD